MQKFLIALMLFTSTSAHSYELGGQGGMENGLAHAAVGYAGTAMFYGFMKRLVMQDQRPRLEDKFFLIAMGAILNFGVAMIKEASDDSRCKASTGKGCLDMGAVGYGMLGVGLAGASIIVWDF